MTPQSPIRLRNWKEDEARIETNLQALQKRIGPCREWCPDKADRCNEPSEYVLWGKLIPTEGLGPRCYDHAAKWVGHDALRVDSGWALIDLPRLAKQIDQEHFPDWVR